MNPYIGRFAPSPTGALHAGSLVAALASWLDARWHGGTWLVRIEDVDTPRCVAGADRWILQQLAQCGLTPDAPPVYQSARGHHYQAALDALIVQGLAYPCTCSRAEIAQTLTERGIHTPRGQEAVYPGTCRPLAAKQAAPHPLALNASKKDAERTAPKAAWRLLTHGEVALHTGDFVLRRKDGLWAYQLAVVVDDALQGITHIVRGRDLLDNTARQIQLQQALGYPTPQYLHTPLVMGDNGEKLSKQNGAAPLLLHTPADALAALNAAAQVLQLSPSARMDRSSVTHASIIEALHVWIPAWGDVRGRWVGVSTTKKPPTYQAIRDLQHLMQQNISSNPKRSLVDELLQERKAEQTKHEME